MQKVNVFAQFPKGGTFYKTEFCTQRSTIAQIIENCDLPQMGIRVYLNGDYIAEEDREKPLSAFKAGNPAFLSVRYFVEQKSASSAKQ